MMMNHVSALGVFILITVAALCLYWQHREINGRRK
jgi:hypothetical protein